LNKKYKEDKFVNTVKNHKKKIQANLNSTIKRAANVVEDIKSDKCKKLRHTAYTSKTRRVLKKKWES